MSRARGLRHVRRNAAALSLALAACDAPTVTRPSAAYSPTALTAGMRYRWDVGRTIRVWTTSAPPSVMFDLGLAVREGMAAGRGREATDLLLQLPERRRFFFPGRPHRAKL